MVVTISRKAVGFYLMPTKLLEQAIEAVSRIGMVTRSSAAEPQRHRAARSHDLAGIYSNRYSLTSVHALACFLLVFGRQLIFMARRGNTDNGGPFAGLHPFLIGLCWRRSSIRVRSCSASTVPLPRAGLRGGVLYFRAGMGGTPFCIWARLGFRFMLAVRGIYTRGSCPGARLLLFLHERDLRAPLVGKPVVALAMLFRDRPPGTEYTGIDRRRRDLRPPIC